MSRQKMDGMEWNKIGWVINKFPFISAIGNIVND